MSTFRKGNIHLALQSIGAAKGRSLLTMLGIIIGIAAVILIVCIGEGVKQQVAAQTAHYGRDVVVVQPGGGQYGTLAANLLLSPQGSLSAADIDTVKTVSGVARAVPIAAVAGSIRGDRTINTPIVIATSVDFPEGTKHKVAYGAFFDAASDTDTVVLGSQLAQKLFEDNVPLGQTVTFRGEQFIVGGILKPFASSPFSLEANFNDALFIPYAKARSLTGSDPATSQLFVKVTAGSDAATVAQSIHRTLVAKHGGADDITVHTALSSNGSSSGDTIHLLTLMTIGIAAIAFIVGGIGIMNVMLVSVTERTQEVGLRKAIGATNQQILRQFMAEAFVLSAVGALLGILLSLASIGLLRLYSPLQPIVVWQIFVIAPLVGLVTGLLFGTFPAIKAARKDPIEALRRR